MSNKLKRYVGLDLFRAILMLIGPAFHIALIFDTPEIITKVDTNNILLHNLLSITHSFRMEFFFLLSGFFSSYLIENKGAQYFWQNRIKRLFYPLVTSLIFILPLTIYTYDLIIEDNPLRTTSHLWFMITLSAVALIYYFYYPLIKKIIDLINNIPHFIIVSLLLTFLLIYTKLNEHAPFLQGTYGEQVRFFLLSSIPRNTTISILGSLLFYKSYKLSNLLGLTSTFIFITLNSIVRSVNFSEINPLNRILLIIIYAYSIAYLMLFIFNYFKNLEIKKSSVITFLVNSSLVIYLVHHPLIFLNTYLIDKIALDSYNFFIMIMVFTYIQSILFFIVLSQFQLTRICFGIKEKVNFYPYFKEKIKPSPFSNIE
ncbi:acyltransferase family protein [Sphingobacterium sp. MYb382]|uniref:acyltransferase family protein n=1 Tax=Sphingobacterium sp. MYb382 TaxID=2745278 RepID=UPI0030A1A1BB